MIKGRLDVIDETMVGFYCPGCKEMHYVYINLPFMHPSWTFNGDYDNPTILPSVKLGDKCHLFVSGGKLVYLDCQHVLNDKIVDLPFPPEETKT